MLSIDSHTTFAYGDKDTSETLGDFLLSPLRCWSARKVQQVTQPTQDQLPFTVESINQNWLDIAGCILTLALFPLTLIATLFGSLCYSLSSTRKEKTSDFVMKNLEHLIQNNAPGTLNQVQTLLIDYEGKYDLDTDRGLKILFSAINGLTRRETSNQDPLDTIDTINRLITFGANPFEDNKFRTTPITLLFRVLTENPIDHKNFQSKLLEFIQAVNAFPDGQPTDALPLRFTFLLDIVNKLEWSPRKEIPTEVVFAVTEWFRQYMIKDRTLEHHPDYAFIKHALHTHPKLHPIRDKLIEWGAKDLENVTGAHTA